jgi:hypothetical protein
MNKEKSHQFLDGFSTLVRGRRTAHSFANDEVPENILMDALDLSLWVPNHKMTRPWSFVRAKSQDLRARIAAVAVDLKNQKEPLSEGKKKALETKYKSEGSLLFCVQNFNGAAVDSVTVLEDYATVSCSIQILSLWFEIHGFSTKWSTGALTRDSRTYEVLSLDPMQSRIVGLLWMGRSLKKKTELLAMDRGSAGKYLRTL